LNIDPSTDEACRELRFLDLPADLQPFVADELGASADEMRKKNELMTSVLKALHQGLITKLEAKCKQIPPQTETPALVSEETEKKAAAFHYKLKPGIRKTVDLNFPANTSADGISVGNPEVLATTLIRIGDQNQLQITPLHKGASDILVRDSEGTLKARIYVTVE
jgi:hypothetical protein